MKNRAQLIQYLIDKFELKSYLEIGVGLGHTFGQIKCDKKSAIDPALRVLTWEPNGDEHYYQITSDQFFGQNFEKFDLVFIDGLHWYEQVIRDIVNSWRWLRPCGFIVLHDCFPTCREMCQRAPIIPEWTGDVWKAIIWFHKIYPMLESCVLYMDYGCGVIKKTSDFVIEKETDWLKPLDFNWMVEHQDELNLRSEYEGFNCNS